jgi:uroporphyrinogen-III synthase
MAQPPFSQIVLTRPRLQNRKLKERVEKTFKERGITVPITELPLLEIVPISEESLAKDLHQSLCLADWVSFVSPNALVMAISLFNEFGLKFPSGLKIAVVGGGSEQSVIDSGIDYQLIIKPNNLISWDSEGLWEALSQFQPNWEGQKIVLIHGQGGRTFLTAHLEQAGAHVTEFAVYQRKPLAIEDPAWQELSEKHIAMNYRSLWMFSSSQAARCLGEALPKLGFPRDFLSKSVAIVSHPRIQSSVNELGFAEIVSILPGDEELMKTLGDFFKTAL